MTRVRIRFVKLGKIRWTSHRDVARMWERAFRRAQLPLAYTAGFSPRPKVSFGLALPTGHESVAEYLDVELADSAGSASLDAGALPGIEAAAPVGMAGVDVPTLPGRLSAVLPFGVDATAAAVIAPGTPSLQEDVASCTWRWAAAPREGTDPLGCEEVASRVGAVLAASSVVVTRTRKGEESTDDIRAGIRTLELLGPVGSDPAYGVWLEAEIGVPATCASTLRGPGCPGPRFGGTPGATDASMDFERRRPEGTAGCSGPGRRDGRAARL